MPGNAPETFEIAKDVTKKEATFEFAKNVTKGKVTCRQEGDIEDKLLMLIPL